MAEKPRTPSIAISLLPVVTLVIMLAVAIYIFRGDSLGGASQIVLLIATSICLRQLLEKAVHIGIIHIILRLCRKSPVTSMGSHRLSSSFY